VVRLGVQPANPSRVRAHRLRLVWREPVHQRRENANLNAERVASCLRSGDAGMRPPADEHLVDPNVASMLEHLEVTGEIPVGEAEGVPQLGERNSQELWNGTSW
jgi:hypothetical protein